MIQRTEKQGRIDFHLHSYASNVTDYYLSNSMAIPESYSDPVETYHTLKARGMQLVTLTDHNSIDGVLELLGRGYEDVFISSEMTATFPEDGCNIHVTVANVSEAQFREIDRLRGNVYEMVDYVNAQIDAEDEGPGRNKIAYFMTHPLMSTQNRPHGRVGALSVQHLEKAVLLFNALEVRNGTRTKWLNRETQALLESLSPELIAELADRHGIEPRGPEPHLKAFLGGSDDHSGINPGRTWTEFPYEGARPVAEDVVQAIRSRRTRPGGAHGGPVTLAHALVKLLYDGQRSKHRDSGSTPIRVGRSLDSLLRFAFELDSISTAEKVAFRLRHWFRRAVQERLAQAVNPDRSFEQVLMTEAHELLADPAFRDRLAETKRTDDKIFLVINALLNQIFTRYIERIRAAGPNNIVRAIKETVALVSSNLFVSLPYFLSYSQQSSDKFLLREVRQRFELSQKPKLLLVTDTLFDVNGVARTIRKMMREAEQRDIDLTVATCLTEAESETHLADPEVRELVQRGRLKIFPSILNVDLPQYDGLQVRCPPFLEFLRFAEKKGFTKFQLSTPGPVGVAGLLASKILQVETSATYHTSFPEYVEHLTGDISLEALAWRYMIQFYHAVDEVVVPSRAIARLLKARGLRKRKLLVLDRWVDTELFHPGRRDSSIWSRHGIEAPDDVVKFVYVGRVSVEKNLEHLATAYRQLCQDTDRAHLIVIGDGPYRAQMEKELAGLPATFTGFLHKEELATAIASADAKLFPSTTDTWGNAPLEAQSCGLPVVVADQGGPQELMVDGETGIRVPGDRPDSLLGAMRRLMHGDLRRRMGEAARRHVEEHRVERPFSAILDAERYRREVKARKARARAAAAAAAAASAAGEPPVADRARVASTAG